jgi:predicted amidohydrolase
VWRTATPVRASRQRKKTNVAASRRVTVAIAQMASGPDKQQNIRRAVDLVQEAAQNGATLVALPETFDYRGDTSTISSIAEPLPGTALGPLMGLAAERGLWILAGSVHEQDADVSMPYNTSVLIDPRGRIAATYRKMHLFDITIGDRSVAESRHYTAGTEVVCAKAAGMKVGLTICYDIRFPELYRCLADLGAELVFIPSSFTTPTGEAHWEILVRARAIENQCFVVAPGQAGVGAGGIATYGNSMIVAPWGRVLARAPQEGEHVISAELDLRELADVRKRLPALRNRNLPASR